MKLIKGLFGIVVLLFVVVLVGLFVVTNSGLQKKWVLGALEGEVGRAELDYVKAGLSSATVRGLVIEKDGTLVKVPEAQVDYSLWGVIFSRQLKIDRLEAKGVDVSLAAARKPERVEKGSVESRSTYVSGETSKPATTSKAPVKKTAVREDDDAELSPFEGILNKASLPVALYVDNVLVEATVRIDLQSEVVATLTGGGIAPGKMGKLYLKGTLTDRSPEAEASELRLDSTIAIDQSVTRDIHGVELTANLEAKGGKLTKATSLNVELSLEKGEAGEENYRVQLEDGQKTRLLSLDVRFREKEDDLKVVSQFGLSNEVLAPFLAGIVLPEFQVTGKVDSELQAKSYQGESHLEIEGKVDQLKRLDASLAHIPGLSFQLSYDGGSKGKEYEIRSLLLSLKQASNNSEILALKLPRPLQFKSLRDWSDLQEGSLDLTISGVRLPWFNGMLSGMSMQTGNLNGAISLTAEDGTVKLTSTKALTLSNFTLTNKKQPLVQKLNLTLPLQGELKSDRYSLTVDTLRLRDESKRTLLQLKATVSGELENNVPEKAELSGAINVYFQEILEQPFATEKLAEAVTLTLKTQATWEESGKSTLASLDLQLKGDNKSQLLSVALLKPLSLDLNKGVGEVTQLIDGDVLRINLTTLPRQIINAFLGDIQLTEGNVTGRFVVGGDGKRIQVKTEQALRVQELSVSSNGQSVVNRINLGVSPKIVYAGNALSIDLPDIDLQSAGQKLAKGKLDVELDLEKQSPLRKLELDLDADLAKLLNQPVAQPWNNLTNGTIAIKGKLGPLEGSNYTLTIEGRDWALREPEQRVAHLSLKASGELGIPGKLSIESPFELQGSRGRSELKLSGNLQQQKEQRQFRLNVDGKTLYTEDVLLLAKAFQAPVSEPPPVPSSSPAPSGSQKASSSPQVKKTAPAASVTQAPWAGYAGKAEVTLKKVVHGYYEVDDLKTVLTVDSEKIVLQPATAVLSGAPLKMDATIDHLPGKRPQAPYGLKASVDLQKFDVGHFLTLGRPGQVAPLTGQFVVKGGIEATAPTLDKFADTATGTFTLNGGPGKLRVLAAAGEKAQGAAVGASIVTGVASAFLGGKVRELPALNQLLSLLQEIDYDTLQIKAKRGKDLNIILDPFLLQGPQVRFNGNGAVTHVPGKAIPVQPLKVDVAFDAKGQTANLLNELRLITGKADSKGYFPGPRFSITGTVSEPDFSELNRLLANTALNLGTQGFGGRDSGEQKKEDESTDPKKDAVKNLLKGLLDR